MTCLNKKALAGFLKVTSLLLITNFFISACADKEATKPTAGGTASFLMDPKESVVVDYVPVDDSNSNGNNFRRLLSLKLCLKDVAETKTIAKADFKIVAGDLKVVKKTDSFGCLIWKELIEFDPNAEKIVFMSRQIEAAGNHVGTVNFEYSVLTNGDKTKVVIYPDQKGSSDDEKSASVVYRPQGVAKSSSASKNYFYDVHVNLAGSVASDSDTVPAGAAGSTITAEARARRASVSDLILNYRQIDYAGIRVDNRLNLIIPYNYVTDFSISLVKQKIDQLAEEKLKKGNFTFHLAVMKTLTSGKSPRPEDIYSVTRFAGQPLGDSGSIRQEIALDFDNIPVLSNNMSVLLTISSQDNPALFADQNFTGTIDGIAANKMLMIRLSPTEVNAKNVYSEYNSYKEKKKMVKLDVAAALMDEGIWPVSSNRISFSRLNKESVTVDLEKLVRDLNNDKSLTDVNLEALCAVVFQDQAAKDKSIDKIYHNCLASPRSVLVAETREYMSSLEEPNVSSPKFNTLEKFTLTSKMNVVHGSASSVGTNRQAKASVQSEVGVGESGALKVASFLSGLKYSVSGSAVASAGYSIESASKSGQSEESSLEGSSAEALYVQQISLTLKAELKKCLVLSVKSKIEQKLINNPFSALRSICVDGVVENRTENYYLIQQVKNAASTIIDPNSPEANPIKMMIRGNRMYSSFMSLVKSKAVLKWLPADADKGKAEMSSLLTEEAPLLMSSGHQVIIPDAQ